MELGEREDETLDMTREMKNAGTVLIGKLQGMRPLEIYRCRCTDNITRNFGKNYSHNFHWYDMGDIVFTELLPSNDWNYAHTDTQTRKGSKLTTEELLEEVFSLTSDPNLHVEDNGPTIRVKGQECE
jgi:hypothetical protein